MESSIALLSQLDLQGFVYLFWHYVIFDLSRYGLSVLAILMAAPWERRVPDCHHRPAVSVLLVGFNEGEALQRTVRSLTEQTHQKLELILVDDGSVDRMREIGWALRRRGELDRVVSTGIRGAPPLGYARHDLVSIVDIDTTFDRDAFEQLIAPMADPQVGAVAGNLAVRNAGTTLMARFQAIEYITSIALGRRFTAALGILSIVSGAFGVFRKQALRQAGGWDVGPGEDADITDKLRRAGWAVAFAPHAWSMTDVPGTLSGFTRQRLRWNRSVIRFRLRKYGAAFDPFWRGFRWENALAMANILFYQVVLSISFYVYIVWLFWTLGPHGAMTVLGATLLIYILQGLLVYGVARVMSGSRAPLGYLLYVPGQILFSTFVQRGIRMIAYLDEWVFRRSYADPYVPSKVRDAADRF